MVKLEIARCIGALLVPLWLLGCAVGAREPAATESAPAATEPVDAKPARTAANSTTSGAGPESVDADAEGPVQADEGTSGPKPFGMAGTLPDPSPPPSAAAIREDLGLSEVEPQGSGEAARPSKVRIETGAVAVSGSLPRAVVVRIVRQEYARLEACFVAGLKRDPKLAGEVTVRFRIETGGAVEGVRGSDSSSNSRFTSCVQAVFREMSFPAPEVGEVEVTFPLVFALNRS